MPMKGSYSCISYNTNDREAATWNQFGGTGVTLTLTADMKSRMAPRGTYQTKLDQRTWVQRISWQESPSKRRDV